MNPLYDILDAPSNALVIITQAGQHYPHAVVACICSALEEGSAGFKTSLANSVTRSI